MSAEQTPRATGGRAPDVFVPGGWVSMRERRDTDEVDFAIVGTGAGGGTLACRLAEAGFSVVAFDAGAYWRPLEDFASDERHQAKLYWTDERIVDGANPIKMGANNSGKSVGGSTVHFAMVALRFRPEWFSSRTKLGYGADWPVDWREMWRYYDEVERALCIAGPVRYPWGPKRPRYPYRAHALTVLDEANAIGKLADPEAEKAAREALSRELAIHLGVSIEAGMVDGRARLSWKGSEVTADLVLAAAGRPPNLDDLNLDAAQLPRDDKGAPCFEQTSRRIGDTQVFIAGDAGGWRPVLHEASRGGRIVGRAAAGGASRWPIPALSIAFTEPNLVEVGIRFDALPDGARTGEAEVTGNGRARIDGDEAGLARLYADHTGKLIGGTIVATGGEHLGQALAMAIQCEVDAATMADMAWYHPTLEEMLQDASRDVDTLAAKGA